MLELKEWESFYVIVGSSGAALTGLQFVVIALTVDVNRLSTPKEVDTFATPTIVHFCAALLVSGILSAPWHSPAGPALLLGLTGAAGAFYALLTAARAARTRHYKPVLEDWLFHVVLPFVAYATIAAGAFAFQRGSGSALFAIAAATLLLLFIGIHNAWDTVTFIAFSATAASREEKQRVAGEAMKAAKDTA